MDFNKQNFSKPGELGNALEAFVSTKAEAEYGKDAQAITQGERFYATLKQAKDSVAAASF